MSGNAERNIENIAYNLKILCWVFIIETFFVAWAVIERVCQ